MKRYIALLRGINISGKNQISMEKLKECFKLLNFLDIKTYLNSGNVIFSSDNLSIPNLTEQIKNMIQNQFSLDIPIFITSQEELLDILSHAPNWWETENKKIYDNLIFIIPPANFSNVYQEIGEPKEGLEQIQEYKNTIFWSFNRKEYQKTNWWPKTASVSISKNLTIRTANTIRKIAKM